MSKSRLEAFSDGVFAVAITLLVLDLHLDPGNGTSLFDQVLAAWPAFAAYVVSFLLIGVVWVNHHSILRLATTIDRPLLFWNLLALMFVTAFPFTTATLSGALVDGSSADVSTAAALYGGASTAFALVFTVLYRRITRGAVDAGTMTPEERSAGLRRFGVGIVVYPVLTIVGVLFAPAMMIGLTALSVYYLFNQTGTSER